MKNNKECCVQLTSSSLKLMQATNMKKKVTPTLIAADTGVDFAVVDPMIEITNQYHRYSYS